MQITFTRLYIEANERSADKGGETLFWFIHPFKRPRSRYPAYLLILWFSNEIDECLLRPQISNRCGLRYDINYYHNFPFNQSVGWKMDAFAMNKNMNNDYRPNQPQRIWIPPHITEKNRKEVVIFLFPEVKYFEMENNCCLFPFGIDEE